MVEQNAVNIFIDVRFILRAYKIKLKNKRVILIGKVLCYGHKDYGFNSHTRII